MYSITYLHTHIQIRIYVHVYIQLFFSILKGLVLEHPAYIPRSVDVQEFYINSIIFVYSLCPSSCML